MSRRRIATLFAGITVSAFGAGAACAAEDEVRQRAQDEADQRRQQAEDRFREERTRLE